MAEKDSIIKKLQRSLESKEKTLNDLQDTKRQADGDATKERDEFIHQLKMRLKDKDHILEVSNGNSLYVALHHTG